MPEVKKIYRLAKVASNFNVGIDTIAERLSKKGFEIDAKPTTKITGEMYQVLEQEFSSDLKLKERADQVKIGRSKRDSLKIDDQGIIKSFNTAPVTPPVETPPVPPVEVKKEAEKKETVVEPPVVEVENVISETIVEKTESIVEPETTVEKEVVEVEKPEKTEKPAEEVVEQKVEEVSPVAEKTPVVEEEVKVPVVEEKPKATPKEEEPKVVQHPVEETKEELSKPKIVGKINLDNVDKGKKPKSKSKSSNKKDGRKDNRNNRKDKPAHSDKKVAHQSRDKKATPPKKVDSQPKKPVQKKVEKTPPKIVKKPEPVVLEKRVVPVLAGPKVLGKIKLPVEESSKKKKSSDDKNKRKRKRISVRRSADGNKTTKSPTSRGGNNSSSGGGNKSNSGNNRNSGNRNNNNNNNRRGNSRKRKSNDEVAQISEKEIQEKIKATMARMSGGSGKSNRQKIRRSKRDAVAEKEAIRSAKKAEESKVLQVTEFITVSELASLLDITATEIISACMSLGTFVSINQRLDAELIDLVAEEFGSKVQFIDISDQEEEEDIVDDPKDLTERAPIVTIMGHVDHGKTSLLDYIRAENVIAGEMGGITQHIGAYEVTTESGKNITFLDTPGHEAFTAMRARGAKVTDIAVIVIAADDAVMPQTKEAISHAQAADVPMIFAFNKIDREESNAEKIKDQLAQQNILVEDWGGEYQSEEISAKTGLNVDKLLDKILLVSELLELKANDNRGGIGSVIEASLDKGRGYVATVLVQNGTLKVGDMIVAGFNYGKVKAMFDERGGRVKEAGPSTPVLVLGLNGAPQAGEKFKVYESEQEAKELATKREQIMREQGRRTKKHITLDEIGRRLALENFKELNLIVKADFDGSVEALSDSLLKLSTAEIQINVIHKSVGQISESDVLLASASDAIIVGFQVRPSSNARQLAEKEDIDVRLYSIIYDAIEEIKSAMEGMLEPKIEEKFVCNVEVRDVFKVTRVGTIAGCYVQEGKVSRNTKIRLVREGIVVYTGEISGLKRFKDDVKDVGNGLECGISLKNFSDIKVGDFIEGYEEIEIKRTL